MYVMKQREGLSWNTWSYLRLNFYQRWWSTQPMWWHNLSLLPRHLEMRCIFISQLCYEKWEHMAKNCVCMYKRRRTSNWALKMCLKTVITANVLWWCHSMHCCELWVHWTVCQLCIHFAVAVTNQKRTILVPSQHSHLHTHIHYQGQSSTHCQCVSSLWQVWWTPLALHWCSLPQWCCTQWTASGPSVGVKCHCWEALSWLPHCLSAFWQCS